MPVVLGRQGIVRDIDLLLSSSEKKAIAESAKSLKESIDRIHENSV